MIAVIARGEAEFNNWCIRIILAVRFAYNATWLIGLTYAILEPILIIMTLEQVYRDCESINNWDLKESVVSGSHDPAVVSFKIYQICNTVFMQKYESYVVERKAVKQDIIPILSCPGPWHSICSNSYAVVRAVIRGTNNYKFEWERYQWQPKSTLCFQGNCHVISLEIVTC